MLIDICDCDVNNKEALSIFRAKRASWKNLILEDPLCISNQINNMLRNDSIFRIFNEARILTMNSKDGSLGLNAFLLNLIDQCFIDSQVMAIRRLTDRNFYDPKKAVISLPRIIDDMLANKDIFTRENYISYDGNMYENVPIEHSEYFHCETKHNNFDKLSYVSDSNRSRNDKVNECVFKKLNDGLKVCINLRTYANKFIAHASDLPGRLMLTENEKKVTLENLNRCYHRIIHVSSFISNIVLYEEELGGIPPFNSKYIKNLEKPMVAKDDLISLERYWKTRESEVSQWNENIWSILN